MITITELQARGACTGLPTAWFFLPRGKPPKHRIDGRLICRHACAVRADCLEQQMAFETGIRDGYRVGIWGGLLPADRARLAGEMKR